MSPRCAVTLSCPALCDPEDCSPPGSSIHGDSPGKNTGVGCHFLLQGIFWTQGSTCISSPALTSEFCTTSSTWEGSKPSNPTNSTCRCEDTKEGHVWCISHLSVHLFLYLMQRDLGILVRALSKYKWITRESKREFWIKVFTRLLRFLIILLIMILWKNRINRIWMYRKRFMMRKLTHAVMEIERLHNFLSGSWQPRRPRRPRSIVPGWVQRPEKQEDLWQETHCPSVSQESGGAKLFLLCYFVLFSSSRDWVRYTQTEESTLLHQVYQPMPISSGNTFTAIPRNSTEPISRQPVILLTHKINHHNPLKRNRWCDHPGKRNTDTDRDTIKEMLHLHKRDGNQDACVHAQPGLTLCHPDSPSTGCSRQEHWGGMPFPPPGDLPNPGSEPTVFCVSLNRKADSLPLSHLGRFIPALGNTHCLKS